MAARPDQDAKRRDEKNKLAPVLESALPGSANKIVEVIQYVRSRRLDLTILLAEIRESRFAKEFEQAASLSPHQPSPVEADGAALWDEAVESLGRSARVLEELAESTGETIARIAARGDRIDRIQKETRALLNALVDSEANA